MAEHDHDRATAREDLCRFVAACYYEPGPEFEEERLFDSMLAAAQRLDNSIAEQTRQLGAAFAAEDRQELLVDYTRLFLGPTQALAQPYESVWATGERTLMQNSTMALLELYEQGGFEIADDFRDLPDHIAAELEFLYLLIYQENDALRSDDAAALASAVSLRRRFIDEHLGRWITPFTAAMRAGAQSEFYRQLAVLTEEVVRREIAAGVV